MLSDVETPRKDNKARVQKNVAPVKLLYLYVSVTRQRLVIIVQSICTSAAFLSKTTFPVPYCPGRQTVESTHHDQCTLSVSTVTTSLIFCLFYRLFVNHGSHPLTDEWSMIELSSPSPAAEL